MSTTIGTLRDLFSSNPPQPGAVDILCLGCDVVSQAGVTAALLLLFVREDTGKMLHPQVYVLDVQGSGLEAAIRSRCSEELSKLVDDADYALIEPLVKKRLHFRSASSLGFDAVLSTLEDIPKDSAVIVVNAALYRPSQPVEQEPVGSGRTTPFGETIRTVIEENEWSVALADFADRLQATAEQKQLYLPLLAGEQFPVFERNMKKLQRIKGAVFGGRYATDAEGHVLQQSTRWMEMISEGMEDAAFGEIDAVSMSELNRALVKAQCLFAVQRSFEGFELLRPFLAELRSEVSPAIQVNVARMALHAGEHAESLALLDSALAADPTDEPTLRALHQHARTMRARPQRERALELLRQRFPRSTYTLGIEVETFLHRRQYDRIVEILGGLESQTSVPEYFRYALALARKLRASIASPYHDVINEVAAVAPDSVGKAVLHCARHALDGGEIDVALRLLMDGAWDEVEAAEVARVIVRAIEKWALSVPSQLDADEVRQAHDRAFQTIISALPFVFQYLANHPENVDLRGDLTSALAPESMGSLGFGILVHLLETARLVYWREVAEPVRDPSDAVTSDHYLEFFKKYFKGWGGRPLVGPPGPIPQELRGEPLVPLKEKATNVTQHLASTIGDDATDKEQLAMHFRIAIDLVQHLGAETELFELFRMVASARADAGVFQDARDLADNALLMLGGRRSAAQKRAAWLVFADAYARCGNLAEAILGWLCAAQHQDVELTPRRMAQDVLLHVRLLRDTRQYGEALSQLQRAKEIVERSDLGPVLHNRLEHLEATIVFARWSNRGEAEGEAAEREDPAKLADLALHPLAAALSKGENSFPAAMFVAQVIALHERRGCPVPEELRDAFAEALGAVPPEESARLKLLADPAPGRDALLALCHTLRSTRFAWDLDMDLRYVRLLARRTLDDVARSTDAEGALLAVELLATHAVKISDPEGTAEARQREGVLEDLRASTAARVLDTTDDRERAALTRLLAKLNDEDGPREPTTIAHLVNAPETLSEIVTDLGRRGIDIQALALNSRRRLVRVSSYAGRLVAPVEEDPSIFNNAELEKWRRDHPFCYCAPDGNKDRRGTISYLEESLAGIGTTAERPSGPVLYVVAHDLADLPANLIRMNAEPGGCLVPVASAPSLTWLHAAWQKPRAPTGRRTAWFLPPSETLLFPPLAILRDNLGEELGRRGFDVVTGVELPPDNRGSDLAIVGAHGSIWFDKGIFRAVSDDDKLVRYSMSEFAARLSGTAVVVLLVCSGGRLDRDTFSFSATGLPYELLRRGCRAVVGSPWPLDVGMANRWAQHFVERWDAGMAVVEAVHLANLELRKFRPDESHFLAMHVIGNPLERAVPSSEG